MAEHQQSPRETAAPALDQHPTVPILELKLAARKVNRGISLLLEEAQLLELGITAEEVDVISSAFARDVLGVVAPVRQRHVGAFAGAVAGATLAAIVLGGFVGTTVVVASVGSGAVWGISRRRTAGRTANKVCRLLEQEFLHLDFIVSFRNGGRAMDVSVRRRFAERQRSGDVAPVL